MRRNSISLLVGRILSLVLLSLPLIALLSDPQSGWAPGSLLLDSRQLMLLLRSLLFSGAVAILCTGAGFGAALGLSTPWARQVPYLRWTPLVFLALPPSVHALSWDLLFTKLNTILAVFRLPGIPLQGWLPALWVQSIALLPLSTGVALLGLYRLPGQIIDQALVFQESDTVFRRVTLPLMTPWLIGTGSLVFVLCLADYTVLSLKGCNSYALEIFSQFAANHDAGRAFFLSLPMMVPILLVAYPIFALLRRLLDPERQPTRTEIRVPTTGWVHRCARCGLFILACQFSVPLFMLGLEAIRGGFFLRALHQGSSEFLYTLEIALATAILGLAPAALLSGFFERQRRPPFLSFFTLLLLLVPASLIGIGWMQIGLSVFPDNDLFKSLLPIAALLSRLVPIGVLVLLSWRTLSDPAVFEAVSVFQVRPLEGWRRIHIPRAIPAFGAAAGLIFAFSLGELGASLMVLPPGKMTISIRLYNALHYGATGAIAASGLMLSLASLTCGLIAVFMIRRWETS